MKIFTAEELTEMLLAECEYIDINPAQINFSEEFQKAYTDFFYYFTKMKGSSVNGEIPANKAFDFFRNIYRVYYAEREAGLLACYVGNNLGLDPFHLVYLATFVDFLNHFNEYFTEKIEIHSYEGQEYDDATTEQKQKTKKFRYTNDNDRSFTGFLNYLNTKLKNE